METQEIKEQQSRLTIIIWISFCVAFIYLLTFLTEITSPSLSEQIQRIDNINPNTQELEQLTTSIKAIEREQFFTQLFGIIASLLVLVGTSSLHYKKSYAQKIYLGGMYTCIAYNLLQIFFSSQIIEQSYPVSIGGRPSPEMGIQEYIQGLLATINEATGIAFFFIALLYLIFNLIFFHNAKTKYLLKTYAGE